MSEKQKRALEEMLETVNPERRRFLERLIVGSGAAVVIGPMSSVLLQAQRGEGKGKGKGDGKGKGEGEGKGKGDGKGKGEGKGKGDGKGKGEGKGKGKGKGTT